MASSIMRLLSYKAQGLNSPMKRHKAFQHYHSQQAGIIFIQETNFPAPFKPSFLHKHFPQFFTANADNKTRGVAILFSKNAPFTLVQKIKDPDGRYLLLKGYIGPLLYSFLSYYAYNKSQVALFSSMFCTLSKHFKGLVVCGGDLIWPWTLVLLNLSHWVPSYAA